MHIRTKLYDIAGQENCDGEPYDTMQTAGDCIGDLCSALEQLLDRISKDKDARFWFLEEQNNARKALHKASNVKATDSIGAGH
jgi:hypothetical protein